MVRIQEILDRAIYSPNKWPRNLSSNLVAVVLGEQLGEILVAFATGRNRTFGPAVPVWPLRSGRFGLSRSGLSRFGHASFQSWSFPSRDISVRLWNLAEILHVVQTYLNQRKVVLFCSELCAAYVVCLLWKSLCFSVPFPGPECYELAHGFSSLYLVKESVCKKTFEQFALLFSVGGFVDHRWQLWSYVKRFSGKHSR